MDKELMTIPYFLDQHLISRTTLYREVDADRLHLTKVGRRSYIAREDAQAWLKALRNNSLHQQGGVK